MNNPHESFGHRNCDHIACNITFINFVVHSWQDTMKASHLEALKAKKLNVSSKCGGRLFVMFLTFLSMSITVDRVQSRVESPRKDWTDHTI